MITGNVAACRCSAWIGLALIFVIDVANPAAGRHQRIRDLAASVLFPPEVAGVGAHHRILRANCRPPQVQQIERAAAIKRERDGSWQRTVSWAVDARPPVGLERLKSRFGLYTSERGPDFVTRLVTARKYFCPTYGEHSGRK